MTPKYTSYDTQQVAENKDDLLQEPDEMSNPNWLIHTHVDFTDAILHCPGSR
jgi:hypothetical protein